MARHVTRGRNQKCIKAYVTEDNIKMNLSNEIVNVRAGFM
jgi:hypothetical protein